MFKIGEKKIINHVKRREKMGLFADLLLLNLLHNDPMKYVNVNVMIIHV